MNIFRRFLTVPALAVLATSIASASGIVTYTSNLATTGTDILNSAVAMTPFQSGAGGVPTNEVLSSFTVTYAETITGTIGISNTGSSSSTITATVDSLGQVYLFTQTPSADLPFATFGAPTDDAFGGQGPDPSFRKTVVNLGMNSSAGPFSYNKSASATTGTISDPASLTAAASPWNAYLDSFTSVSTSATGSGTGVANYANTVSGIVSVAYTYTDAPSAPEPATFVMFGSGLIGLGLLRKRTRKS
jgi:hypothetical protein